MELSLPRGIRDIEPDEQEVHERIRGAFSELSRTYGFRLMEPGPIESIAVLRAKSGRAVDEQIYSFKDKAGREIGLRFDLTVGMTRYVVGRRGLKPPIKLASFGGVWRYDEPQHARYRWFHQWDIEIFGDPSVEADAEIIDLSYNLFQKLNLRNVTVQVGDRRVVEEYIRKSLGVSSEDKVVEMLRALDKVGKKTEEELTTEYETKGIGSGEMGRLFAFGRLKGPPSQVLEKLAEHRLESQRDLATLRESLEIRGIRDVEYNLSIVRGIDYYTSIVFEVVDNDHRDLGSLCGGGRYDILPRIFGRPDLAATGAAGGVERIALSIPRTGVDDAGSVYVAFTEEGLLQNGLEVLSRLRAAGVTSEMGGRGKSLSKQLEDSVSRGFTWVVIVGKREISSGALLLKDLKDRTEEKLPLDEIITKLSRRTE